MAQKKYNEIFKRFYAGIQNRRDEKELLESDQVNSMMQEQWEHPEKMKAHVEAPDFDALFSRIEQKAYSKQKTRHFPIYRLVAGIALLVGLTAALYFFFQKKNVVEQIQFTTLSGEIKSFTLPDGSSLWLGENSHVSFASNFNDDRKIDMQGLAFFKVIKNNTPFRVKAGLLSVEVTGTAFSVSNYPGAAEIEATLVEGVVKIHNNNGQFIKQLKPDEKIIYNKASGEYKTINVNARELTVWKEEKLIFNNSSLTEIAEKLSSRYGVKFQTDKNVAAYKFTFTIGSETLDQTLFLISSTAPVKVKRTDDIVILSLKK